MPLGPTAPILAHGFRSAYNWLTVEWVGGRCSCGVSAVRVREVWVPPATGLPGLSPADPAVRCRLDTASAPPPAASRGVPRLHTWRWIGHDNLDAVVASVASARAPVELQGRGGQPPAVSRQIGADRGPRRRLRPAVATPPRHGRRRRTVADVWNTDLSPRMNTAGCCTADTTAANGTGGHRGRAIIW